MWPVLCNKPQSFTWYETSRSSHRSISHGLLTTSFPPLAGGGVMEVSLIRSMLCTRYNALSGLRARWTSTSLAVRKTWLPAEVVPFTSYRASTVADWSETPGALSAAQAGLTDDAGVNVRRER